ncbi:MAG: flavin reductase family protein [Desulfobacterales bacterium]|nr:flavin reductase family protein [Candidatus Bathyarchaeota archaeon]NIR14031.1 flavin reductase family protein [Desulfobacterales bacterium]
MLVTTLGADNQANIITLTLVGAACWQPPTISLGVGRSQHSRRLIDEAGELVVNIPKTEMLRDVEYCGLVSGRDVDKCARTAFTMLPSSDVKPPLIKECPVNLECKVRDRMPLGSNVLFLAEVVRLHVNQEVLDEEGGVDLGRAKPVMFNLTNSYWGIGEKLSDYGFTKEDGP